MAAVPKRFFPFLVVLPGLAAAAFLPASLAERYDLALPELLLRYYGPGLVGLGVTAPGVARGGSVRRFRLEDAPPEDRPKKRERGAPAVRTCPA